MSFEKEQFSLKSFIHSVKGARGCKTRSTNQVWRRLGESWGRKLFHMEGIICTKPLRWGNSEVWELPKEVWLEQWSEGEASHTWLKKEAVKPQEILRAMAEILGFSQNTNKLQRILSWVWPDKMYSFLIAAHFSPWYSVLSNSLSNFIMRVLTIQGAYIVRQHAEEPTLKSSFQSGASASEV